MTNGDPPSLDSTANILIGSFTTVAAALTAFGAVSGELTRMLRNYPILSLFAALLISTAIGLGIGAKAAITGRQNGLPYLLIGLGIPCFVGGLVCAMIAATQAPHGLERPQITARLSYQNGLSLVGDVKAEDLQWSDFVEVTVRAERITIDQPHKMDWTPLHYLYVSHTGPDSNGEVNATFNVPIRPEASWGLLQVSAVVANTPTSPSCRANAPKNFGCVAVRLPIAYRPQVVATWSAAGSHPTLTVDTKAQDLPETGLVQTTIITRSSKKSTVVSQMDISPDNRGVVDQAETVPISRDSKLVCVIADRLRGDAGKIKLPLATDHCPTSTDERVTDMLAVPIPSVQRPVGWTASAFDPH